MIDKVKEEFGEWFKLNLIYCRFCFFVFCCCCFFVLFFEMGSDFHLVTLRCIRLAGDSCDQQDEGGLC